MSTLYQPDKKLFSWMRDIRRDLHRHPEIGFKEFRTAERIKEKLKELDIPFRSGIAGTGIVATLGKQSPEAPWVALRADMDALPIEEKTGLSFSSKNTGVMHACGHDGHVAMLLGAGALLKPTELTGNVVLLFQPSEEDSGGASHMIKQGALENVDAIFGGHIDRHLKVGEIAVEPGIISAYTDRFDIEIRGRGGHAAKPHETVDSIVVASLLVMSIQTLVSREVNPSHPTVVTVGRIQGGNAANVIADHAVLQGTIRTTLPTVRNKIISGLTRMVDSMKDLYGAETSVKITKGYPPIINHPEATAIAKDAAEQVVGPHGVIGLPHPSLGGEDFSYYLERIPGCFVRFGAKDDEHKNAPAHSPFFHFNEKVLTVGSSFLAHAAATTLTRINEIKD